MTPRGKSAGRSGDPRKRGPRKPAGHQHEPENDGLTVDIDAALADPHPLSMLALASGLAAILDPRIPKGPAGPAGTELPPIADFVTMLVAGEQPQTDALAWVLAHLVLDDLRRSKTLRGVDRTRLPAWLLQLGSAEVYAAWQTIDLLRDGSNIALGVRLGGFDLTVVTFIDLNNAGALKDGFVVPESLAAFQQTWASAAPPEGMESIDLTLADARAQVEHAIQQGHQFWPPFESDSWPQMQPMLEWLLGRCPPGGRVMVGPGWTDADTDRVMSDFITGPEGGRFADDPDHTVLLRTWLDFGRYHGFGDPLLASGSKIEIFLLDWVLDHLDASDAALAKLPELLEAFVPAGHRQRGVSATETAGALATLRQVGADFVKQLVSGGQVFNLPRLPDGRPAVSALVRRMLAAEVGGPEQLANLDATPLPTEDLELDDLPADLHERLRTIDAASTEACRTFFDDEVRTAVRRLTHDIALADPQVFRRRAKDVNTAATLCWMIARENDLLGPYRRVESRRLLDHFEVASVSSRATTLRTALLGSTGRGWGQPLRTPRYLLGSYRALLIARRDAGPMAVDG